MNINDFESQVDPIILKRGIGYYLNEHVESIEELTENVYTIQISGTQTYKVLIECSVHGEIRRSLCTCPYEGPHCKHEVAAYYAIKYQDADRKSERSLEEDLNELTKEELVTLVLDLSEKYPNTLSTLAIHLSQTQKTDIKFVIDDIVDTYKGRDNFISYYEMTEFSEELSDMLDTIKQIKKPDDLFELLTYMLKTLVESIQYSDDSGGETGMLIDETLALMESKAQSFQTLSLDLKEHILEILIQTVETDAFRSWETFKLQACGALISWYNEETLKAHVLHYIDSLLEKLSKEDYGDYLTDEFYLFQYKIIQTHETREKERLFLIKNLDKSSLKEKYFDILIQEQKYDEVISRTLESEEEDGHDKWKEYRYKAYKKSGRVTEQKELAYDMLTSREGFTYYLDLKELSEDKSALYQEVKDLLKNNLNGYSKSFYFKLIKKENDTEALLNYSKENPYTIVDLIKVLKPVYPSESKKVYDSYIRQRAEMAKNRKEYQYICRLLERYQKEIGIVAKLQMIDELEVKYNRKPAFLDELNKIK